MTPFITLEGIAAPIEGRNIDTDQIIPARFLKKSRGEYADYLFYDLRMDTAHQSRPEFVLNQQVFQGASVLVCDENFGCGSSREAAVYALVDFGIRAVLAPSFGDIFYNNCLCIIICISIFNILIFIFVFLLFCCKLKINF
jgi:3-isopropylmalate/(R)-2-methylmalate dehydratase small subunit